jgi:hypothetical protein
MSARRRKILEPGSLYGMRPLTSQPISPAHQDRLFGRQLVRPLVLDKDLRCHIPEPKELKGALPLSRSDGSGDPILPN